MVDTLGLLLAAVVHPADIQDRDGARLVLAQPIASEEYRMDPGGYWALPPGSTPSKEQPDGGKTKLCETETWLIAMTGLILRRLDRATF